jgi:D-beta-D-heptose 7-phosphate kinase/D-beta-D-heptose 1-phosphate adenosyltransferase
MVPTVARQVYDVTGAGDMVLAMLAGALANGADWRTAVELANTAAGLEVEKFGVVPIEMDEVLLSLLHRQQAGLGKIRTLEQLLPELAAYRKQGQRIAFTNGCFDILHAGHISFLRASRQAGDLLVVGLNSDRSIRRIKGPGRPVNNQDDRLMVLSELQSVDYLVLFDQDTPLKLIKAIRPDALVKGADYRHDQVVGAAEVEAHGGKVVLVKLVAGRSTSHIISRIAAGAVRS